MFAAIPFPRARSRSPSIESTPPTFNKPPTVSLFGQRSTGEPTTIPDCPVPPRNNTPLLGDSVATTQDDRPESQPVETNELNSRKLKLTVETLEKQSYLLSLQIWHYECQYGLPHSEFSQRFEFGCTSPIPSSRGQDEEGAADKDVDFDPGEGTSAVKIEPGTEDDIVVKKEELMDDSDDTIDEEGQWTEKQSPNQDKSSSEGLFGNILPGKPSETPTAHDTSFGNLFGPAPIGINFGAQPSTSIFGGIVQTKAQPPATLTNFRLPQVSANGTANAAETSQLTHRQLQLAVETMEKQSHLLNLQILQYEFRHRIPHSEYSRKIALQAAMNGGLQKEGGAADGDHGPLDYTIAGENQ